MSRRDPLAPLRRLLSELGRRRVVHAVAVYAVVAWVAVQVAAIAFPALFIPRQALTALVFVAVLGFPVTVALAWAFEITDDGIRRTPTVAEGGALSPGLRVGFAAAVLLATAGLGWVGWETWLSPRARSLPARAAGSGAADPASGEAPRLEPSRVAVLYFDDHSPGDTLTAFADGLTENLIHRLAQVEGLEVVSRHGVKPYRETEATLDSIARDLRAGSLVEGSVEAAGDELEVTVQLIDGRSRAHLMSEQIRRPADDVFALQDTLAHQVSRLLRERLGRQVQLASWQSRTSHPEAWRRVQEADRLREDALELSREGETETARRLFDRADSLLGGAASLDPDWSAPAVLRARVTMARLDPYEARWSPEERTLATDAIRRVGEAAGRDSGVAQARAVRGQLRYWLSRHVDDRDSARRLLDLAESDLRAAVEDDPGSARAWYGLSQLLHEGRGDLTGARYAAERAEQADAYLRVPAGVHWRYYSTAANEPDYETARYWCRTGREKYPEDLRFRACELALLATDGAGPPDPARAWELVDEIRSRARPANRARFVAIARRQVAAVLARAGLADSARGVLRRARRDSPAVEDDPTLAYDEAHAHLLLGDEERALDLLARFAETNPEYRAQLSGDPWFEPLRERPDYRRLVRE